MNDELAEQVLSDNVTEASDDDRGSVESAVVMGGMFSIVAVGIWMVLGSLSGWETTGVFGVSATEATVGAVALFLGNLVVWRLPVEDDAKRSLLILVITGGFFLFATGVLIGTDMLGATLAGMISGGIN